MTNLPERIPYDQWRWSQLSIARHYGAITIQGVFYHIEKGTNDLVRHEPKPRKRKKKP